MSVESVCIRCLNPGPGWPWDELGFRCVDCWRQLLGDDEVDDIVLNEHPELVDDDLLRRMMETEP